MRLPWQIWSVFAACLVVATAAVGWLSYRALESERAEQTARAQAVLEENARLALWRLDSAVAPLIAQENANPFTAFRSAIAESGSPGKTAEGAASVGAAPPRGADSQVKLHFQLDAAGKLTSPEVPSLASQSEMPQRLDELARFVDRPTLLARLPRASLQFEVSKPDAASYGGLAIEQQARSDNELQFRRQAVLANSANEVVLQKPLIPSDKTAAMTPLWIDGQLLLVRQVVLEGKHLIQGCWFDWPMLRDRLLADIGDLLPRATLEPTDAAASGEASHQMAALPVTLVTGELPAIAVAGLSPVRLSLLVTWVSLALAALAVAMLLRGVLSLSERRAAFVSAVTHELRTPLTTFRMYAEMLAEGMVAEADRHRYLETLQIEAGRLSHLVENVLAYARLERGGPAGRIGPVPVGQLLDRAGERLAGRAAAAGFVVEQNVPADVLDVRALADPAAVEQILFNLVDNACKYAQAAEDRRLRLDATGSNGQVLIRLRDGGPGVSSLERKRLFQPFRKSARDAAQSSAGVGLGLALCRRLARDMGGELSLEQTSGGASFVLALKAAPATAI